MPDVIINGPEGRLEGRYQPGKNPTAGIALLLHPHPLHGGNLDNKVAHTLARSFLEMGYAALRVNFRGAGASDV